MILIITVFIFADRLSWKYHVDAVRKKVHSRKLGSFEIREEMLQMFYTANIIASFWTAVSEALCLPLPTFVSKWGLDHVTHNITRNISILKHGNHLLLEGGRFAMSVALEHTYVDHA